MKSNLENILSEFEKHLANNPKEQTWQTFFEKISYVRCFAARKKEISGHKVQRRYKPGTKKGPESKGLWNPHKQTHECLQKQY